jgi:uncharacterized protein (UPF0332 family)
VTPLAEARLAKSRRFLKAAEVLLAADLPDIAVGRCYYAMLTSAQAMLEQLGDLAWRHESVRARFAALAGSSQEFVRSDVDWFRHLSQLRILGDYDPEANFTHETVEECIEHATAMVERAARWLADHD